MNIKFKLEFVHWTVIYVLIICHHRVTHIPRYSTRDGNLLTFVRLASCVVIRDDEYNAYPFLCSGRQFIDEFSDAFEVEDVGWKNGHLEKDCDVFRDANSINGSCGR